jgi:hypothetical protein
LDDEVFDGTHSRWHALDIRFDSTFDGLPLIVRDAHEQVYRYVGYGPNVDDVRALQVGRDFPSSSGSSAEPERAITNLHRSKYERTLSSTSSRGSQVLTLGRVDELVFRRPFLDRHRRHGRFLRGTRNTEDVFPCCVLCAYRFTPSLPTRAPATPCASRRR